MRTKKKTSTKKSSTKASSSPKAPPKASPREDPDLKVKLGVKANAPEEKIVYCLNRLMSGNPKTWRAMNITEADFKAHGVQVIEK